MQQIFAHKQNDDELSNAVKFLKKRYAENAVDYHGSFAKALNNEAAVEIAEVLFPSKVVREALSVIECMARNKKKTNNSF